MSQTKMMYKQGEINPPRPFLSKGEYVYQVLKGKIADGYLERNKTYTIVEIAESLGVSRTPVGEAVKILASQDYVLMFPGVGFRVKELTIADIRENLTISGALEEAVLRKILQDPVSTVEPLRRAIEKSWKAMRNRQPDQYTQASADFHKALYGMACLPKLTAILQESVLVHELWYREGANRFPETIEPLIADHEAILAVIESRDYGRISEVIQTHVEHCVEVLTKVIKG